MANELDAFRGQLSPELITLLSSELFSDDESGANTANAKALYYKPGASGNAAAPANVYTSWAEAHAVARIVADAGLLVELIVDDQHSTYARVFGGGTAANIPAGDYDMTNIKLSGMNDWGSFDFRTRLEFEDGAIMRNLNEIGGGRFDWTNASTTDSPCIDSVVLTLTCNTFTVENYDASQAPMFKNTQGLLFLDNHCVAVMTLGRSDKLAPVFELDGGDLIILDNSPSLIRDNVFLDTPNSGVFDYQKAAEGAGQASNSSTWSQPGIESGTLLFGDIQRHMATLSQAFSPLLVGDSPFDAQTSFIRQVYDVDSTGGPVAMSLPRSSPQSGRQAWVKDMGGNASGNNITIDLTIGGGTDTFEDGSTSKVINTDWGAAYFVSDGYGVWRRMSPAA
jgi:hypothetical protein